VNEKRILERAGLRAIDDIIAKLEPNPAVPARSVNGVADYCRIARGSR
jgi:hypothetical protein